MSDVKYAIDPDHYVDAFFVMLKEDIRMPLDIIYAGYAVAPDKCLWQTGDVPVVPRWVQLELFPDVSPLA